MWFRGQRFWGFLRRSGRRRSLEEALRGTSREAISPGIVRIAQISSDPGLPPKAKAGAEYGGKRPGG
jgi:hypothetical protein